MIVVVIVVNMDWFDRDRQEVDMQEGVRVLLVTEKSDGVQRILISSEGQ